MQSCNMEGSQAMNVSLVDVYTKLLHQASHEIEIAVYKSSGQRLASPDADAFFAPTPELRKMTSFAPFEDHCLYNHQRRRRNRQLASCPAAQFALPFRQLGYM